MIGIIIGVVLLGCIIVGVARMYSGKSNSPIPNSTDARSSSYSGSLGKSMLTPQEAFGEKEASPPPPGRQQHVRFGKLSFANLSPQNRRNHYGDGKSRNLEEARKRRMENWWDEDD